MESQTLPPSTPATKIRTSLFSLAMCDALGAPAEFQVRGTFAHINTLQPNPNFGLEVGTWTDDTSMALCLAKSLTRNHSPTPIFSLEEQAKLYVSWFRTGYLSAVGYCFDTGIATRSALTIWEQRPGEALAIIGKTFAVESKCGNGSLMRVLPIPLAYFRDEGLAMARARESSTVTHPHEMCQEACALYTLLICRILQWTEAREYDRRSKQDLLDMVKGFEYKNGRLRDALASGEFVNKPRERISSSGYVLHTLEAALWAFFTTRTFEEGAVLVVNLGDDADTVAAVYGGLAGVWYADVDFSKDSSPPRTGYWSERVRGWREGLVKPEVLEEVVGDLLRVNGLEE
ncbi:ADP-ribosylglycohydrolase [Choiromyces venosus 120613-1]|uniref:ADP-ribosylhydrolase ARH3 n=1 Tax=Choiromyces venosus 120613-1 TaxID=1336337 RepID=A0A3N4JRY7_9PEZI|nr:ADP-ribosylglycohydrolase [Choiromyces venosus 120613-1]